jgi:hypothetical protein
MHGGKPGLLAEIICTRGQQGVLKIVLNWQENDMQHTDRRSGDLLVLHYA